MVIRVIRIVRVVGVIRVEAETIFAVSDWWRRCANINVVVVVCVSAFRRVGEQCVRACIRTARARRAHNGADPHRRL
jgi:hypothetical protein